MIKKILIICLIVYAIAVSLLFAYVAMKQTTLTSTTPRRADDNSVTLHSRFSLFYQLNSYLDEPKPTEKAYSISLVEHHNLRNSNEILETKRPIQPILTTNTNKLPTNTFPLQILKWNNAELMFPENEVECSEKRIKFQQSKVKIKICLRNSKDIYSDNIRKTNSFNCPIKLFKLWNEQCVQSNGIYMEIGAGIGNCLLQMLYYKIESIAFEPVPQNLYLLTKSILMNKNMNKYITLYGNALGGYTRHDFVYSDNENWMESTINKHINTTNPIANNMVDIFKLDEILLDINYNISVLSLNVNGYEYHVLTGAVKLLNKKCIKSIYCNINCDKLSSFNVDVNLIFSFLEVRKYVIENKNECVPGLVYNVIARLKQ